MEGGAPSVTVSGSFSGEGAAREPLRFAPKIPSFSFKSVILIFFLFVPWKKAQRGF